MSIAAVSLAEKVNLDIFDGIKRFLLECAAKRDRSGSRQALSKLGEMVT